MSAWGLYAVSQSAQDHPNWPMTRRFAARMVDGDVRRPSGRGFANFSVSNQRGDTPLAPINVTLAAYESFSDARAEWDELELAADTAPSVMVDAALVERTLDEVSEFHFQSSAGWGRGVVASAVCGVLWPPSMLVGALAGSVGGHIMNEVRRGLSREAIGSLGEVMEKGTFITVAIADRGYAPTTLLGPRVMQIASLPLSGTAQALHDALELDDSED